MSNQTAMIESDVESSDTDMIETGETIDLAELRAVLQMKSVLFSMVMKALTICYRLQSAR